MADEKDEHSSPQNPDNRIELERVAADEKHAAQIAANPAGAEQGKALHEPLAKPRAGTRRPSRKQLTEVPSTGHDWDGITEYDNPMPRWWLWTFYATIVWAILYTVAYPAWPLLSGSTRGILGHTTRGDVAAEMDRVRAAQAPMEQAIASTPLQDIPANAELFGYAQHAGAAVFRTWCAQCHGAGAAGARGYPNLLDNDWLWGGSLEDIYVTVRHGIRDPHDDDTRYSEMPRFGRDELLDSTQIRQVASYVLDLGDQPHDAGLATAGAQVYADNCASCHAEDGTGDREQGAPSLTDAVWLYFPGNRPDLATLSKLISDGPYGVMPSWNARLTDAQIREVALYVHSLGGGE